MYNHHVKKTCKVLLVIIPYTKSILALLVNSSYTLTVLHSYLHGKIGHVTLAEKYRETNG